MSRRRTIEQLRQVSISQGIVEGISWSSVQRILAQAELRPHSIGCRTRSFVRRSRRLRTVFESTTRRSRALCRRKNRHAGWSAALPTGLPLRVVLDVASSSTSDTMSFRCSHGTSRRKTSSGKKSLPTTPKAKCTSSGIISSIHYDGPVARWSDFNRRHGDRFILHYTPKHASWVNQVELFFSILQRQCLRDASFCSVGELRAAVLEHRLLEPRKGRIPSGGLSPAIRYNPKKLPEDVV